MVEDAPRVDDVELAQVREQAFVQYRAFPHVPRGVPGKVAAAELAGACNGVMVDIERNHCRTEPPGRQAEQPTAAPRVEEAHATEVGPVQHGDQRLRGGLNARFVDHAQKRSPVAPKGEAPVRGRVAGMRA